MLLANQYTIPGSEVSRQEMGEQLKHSAASPEAAHKFLYEELDDAPEYVDQVALSNEAHDAARPSATPEVSTNYAPEAIRAYAAGAGERIMELRGRYVSEQNETFTSTLRSNKAV